MDTTQTVIIAVVVLLFAYEFYTRKYGGRHWAGGGTLKSDDTWILASETQPRPFYWDVDSQILYREISFQPVTEEPKIDFTVRMEAVYAFNISSVQRVIEPTFTEKNPPRPGEPLSTFYNEPSIWYFSRYGPVTDEQMSLKTIEELRKTIAAKDEELVQERAQKKADIKEQVATFTKAYNPPTPIEKKE